MSIPTPPGHKPEFQEDSPSTWGAVTRVVCECGWAMTVPMTVEGDDDFRMRLGEWLRHAQEATGQRCTDTCSEAHTFRPGCVLAHQGEPIEVAPTPWVRTTTVHRVIEVDYWADDDEWEAVEDRVLTAIQVALGCRLMAGEDEDERECPASQHHEMFLHATGFVDEYQETIGRAWARAFDTTRYQVGCSRPVATVSRYWGELRHWANRGRHDVE